MRQFTIYDKVTGEISRVMTQAKEPKIDPSEGMIEGDYAHDKFLIVDGAPYPLVKTKATAPEGPEGGVLNVLTPEDEARLQRNTLLAAYDWTQVADAPVDQAAWAAYRQKLRDLPETTSDFGNIVWPTPP
tara:strand:- start:107 stop:496 length:390 start_codon:yes stop_codon:yes gene_type:complete